MSQSHQAIFNQCEVAARGVLHLLPKTQADEYLAYITTYGEWLLGLECIIDWLFEEDKAITNIQFAEFEKAYKLMDLGNDERLANLRSLAES